MVSNFIHKIVSISCISNSTNVVFLCCPQLFRPLPPLRMAALLARNPCIPGAKATWDRRGGGVLHICAGPDLVEQGEEGGGCRLEVLSCFREMAGGGAVGLLQALLSTDNDTRSKAEVGCLS